MKKWTTSMLYGTCAVTGACVLLLAALMAGSYGLLRFHASGLAGQLGLQPPAAQAAHNQAPQVPPAPAVTPVPVDVSGIATTVAGIKDDVSQIRKDLSVHHAIDRVNNQSILNGLKAVEARTAETTEAVKRSQFHGQSSTPGDLAKAKW